MNISKHITYIEATSSETAIKYTIANDPNPEQLEAMRYVAENIFEKVRNYFNVKIGISSFFRSEQLNRKIKGSITSQHMKGEAIDIDAAIYGVITNLQIFDYIKNNLEFDQLIAEYPNENGEPKWVHVSLKRSENRKEILTSKRIGKETKYIKL